MTTHFEVPGTGLTDVEIMEYLGNGKQGYGWHISNLMIYDKPKELSDFHQACAPCIYYKWCAKSKCPDALKKAPQSWCYVEELPDDNN